MAGRLTALSLVVVGVWYRIAGLAAQTANGVTAGEPLVEPPTLISLGLEWPVEGDANRNAAVAVEYRRKGATAWRKGLPLLRIGGERTAYLQTLNYTAPHMFAGSVFDLDEDSDYEVRLTLSDPDGVKGRAQRVVTAHTRPEPRPSATGKVYHVYPAGYTGTKQEPAFMGLLAGLLHGTRSAATGAGLHRRACTPGRHDPGPCRPLQGLRPQHLQPRDHLRADTTCCGTPWDGTYFLTQIGHRIPADRDQGGRRRRGDLRRRRQQHAVQRDGCRLPLLRGDHLPEHRPPPSRRA